MKVSKDATATAEYTALVKGDAPVLPHDLVAMNKRLTFLSFAEFCERVSDVLHQAFLIFFK